MRVVGAEDSQFVAVPDVLVVSALRNLLDNALRHTPSDTSVVLEIARVGVDQIRLTVLDSGPGLTDAECEQATERFWRRTKTPEGSGLGLSIVKAIAARYGGDLQLSRPSRGGLSASLILPLQPAGPMAISVAAADASND